MEGDIVWMRGNTTDRHEITRRIRRTKEKREADAKILTISEFLQNWPRAFDQDQLADHIATNYSNVKPLSEVFLPKDILDAIGAEQRGDDLDLCALKSLEKTSGRVGVLILCSLQILMPVV